MIRHLTLNRALFFITGTIALVVAAIGLINPAIYTPVVSERILSGVYTQDLLVFLSALVLLWQTALLRVDAYRKAIVIQGILGFWIYAYAIYAFEQVYTWLYPLYLLTLALSFYSLLVGLVTLNDSRIEQLRLPRLMRYGAAGYGFFVAIMFNFVWLSQLMPLLRSANRIEYTFSVYVIDLVFIMPAFMIAAVLAIRRQAMGLVGLPILFIVGVGILSPLSLAEILKPLRYGMARNMGDFWLYTILSLVFLLFVVAYLITFKAGAEQAE